VFENEEKEWKANKKELAQVERTVEVERLREEGTSLKSILFMSNCSWQAKVHRLLLSHPFTHSFTPNAFCQLGLSLRASHNTTNLAAVGVSVAVPDVMGFGRGPADTAGAAPFASAKPPPTCSSSLEIASIPLSRAVPPESVTNSCNHAATCTSAIEICSPAHEAWVSASPVGDTHHDVAYLE
jgi:hypothetical protein